MSFSDAGRELPSSHSILRQQTARHPARKGSGEPTNSGRRDEVTVQKLQRNDRDNKTLKDALFGAFDLTKNIAQYGPHTTQDFAKFKTEGWPMVDYRKRPSVHIEPPYAPDYIKDGLTKDTENHNVAQGLGDKFGKGLIILAVGLGALAVVYILI